jgi:DNA replication protein DnaC
MEIWSRPQTGRLLVLAGNNGNGKTHCAKAVYKWIGLVGHEKTWFDNPGHRSTLQCIFWRWPALLDRLKNGDWDLVDDMMTIPVLIIDELGGGHDPSRVGVDKLCQVLSRREKRWTLITTNVMPDAWEEIFDRRVASRFFRNSTLVDLSEVPDFNIG